jgi:hypothetical protein
MPYAYPSGGLMAKIKFGNAMLNAEQLVASTPADIPTGMAQLGARRIPNMSGINVYYVP